MPARGSELRLGPSWRGAPGGQLSSEGSGGVRRSPAEAAQLRRELERPRPGAARTRRSSHQVATRSQHQELGRPRLVSQAEVRQSQAEVRSGPAQSQLRARSQRQVPGSSTRQAPGESQLEVPACGPRARGRAAGGPAGTQAQGPAEPETQRHEVRRMAQARGPAVSTGTGAGAASGGQHRREVRQPATGRARRKKPPPRTARARESEAGGSALLRLEALRNARGFQHHTLGLVPCVFVFVTRGLPACEVVEHPRRFREP